MKKILFETLRGILSVVFAPIFMLIMLPRAAYEIIFDIHRILKKRDGDYYSNVLDYNL